MSENKVYALIDYEDTYVQPLLLAALKANLPPELLVLINDLADLPSPSSKVLQWRQYEILDFDHLLQHPRTSLANSYIIRKALIRKHYLSATVNHWLTKQPRSVLRDHVKPSVEFEVDYAEFLDDALVEAYELKESWDRNAAMTDDCERETWILKPGMSDRGQGIRLFSSEEELTAIFEEWEPPESDDGGEADQATNGVPKEPESSSTADGIITSHLRHFVAQPYIHPPLLLASPHPAAGRKFHIRTYVLAVGALKVFAYRRMLALFAAQPYTAPCIQGSSGSPNPDLSRHLTNTCLQTGEREGSVYEFSDLPSHMPGSLPPAQEDDWKDHVFGQICKVTAEVFEAAARTMSVHFQPLPNAFEVFGVDFLVDANGTAWLLEINAFPGFAQTGEELRGVVEGLMQGVVDVAITPFFLGVEDVGRRRNKSGDEMVEVLNLDLGRR